MIGLQVRDAAQPREGFGDWDASTCGENSYRPRGRAGQRPLVPYVWRGVGREWFAGGRTDLPPIPRRSYRVLGDGALPPAEPALTCRYVPPRKVEDQPAGQEVAIAA